MTRPPRDVREGHRGEAAAHVQKHSQNILHVSEQVYEVQVLEREVLLICFFFFQAEDGIRDLTVTGVQTCALPIYRGVRECARRQANQLRGAGGAARLRRWRRRPGPAARRGPDGEPPGGGSPAGLDRKSVV